MSHETKLTMMVEAADGVTVLTRVVDLPVPPHVGMMIRVCDCCDPRKVGENSDITWNVLDDLWECTLWSDWSSLGGNGIGIDKAIEHWEALQWTHQDECLERFAGVTLAPYEKP